MAIIHTGEDESTQIHGKAAAASPWTLPSAFHFTSFLQIINNNSTNTDNKSISSSKDDSSWSWNWKPIDFNTPQVKCPKALNTLLGKKFSTCNPSGVCPTPCVAPSHGCTCKTINNNVLSKQKNEDRDNVENNIAPHLEDGELEEGQLSEEMVLDDVEEEEENKTEEEENKIEEEEDKGFKSQGYCFGYGYNSFNFSNGVPVQNVPDTKMGNTKAKRNQRRRRQRQRKAAAESSKQSAGNKKEQQRKNEEKKRGEGDLIGKFKNLECAEKSSQEPFKEEVQKQDKPNDIETGERTLASFFEGEIGLWTTQTVDEVLRDTNAEKDVNKKAKRGPLTAERKLKKKIAKKKKKVQKDKQLGIKRLKLVPVTKPKQVILCRYYMKGRCAQGKQCPFSHDGVPITKSEICKYYVNNSCLKGDECPFSHDLSTFPCKFYHTKGYCLDGDSCRFSHKPITEEDMVKILKPNELGKQEIHEPESAQTTVQNIVGGDLQKSDAHCPFSVGDRGQNFYPVEHSKSALESNQQISVAIGATSVLNSGKSNSDEHLDTAIVKDQHIPGPFSAGHKPFCQNGATSFVSSSSSFPAIMYGNQLRDKGEHDALLAAREAAFSALAPVADHEANLISLGLVRVPTFISSAHPSADRDIITDREHKEVLKENHNEQSMGQNEKIPHIGFLNGSKSAIKILEDILSGNANSDKEGNCKYMSSISM